MNDPHDSFLKNLNQKIPQKSKLVETLTEILFMEKDAVYRRLSGKVPFTFPEVFAISKKLNISLDLLDDFNAEQSRHFVLRLIEYSQFLEIDYQAWENYNNLIALAKNDPGSEIAESSNLLPVSIYSRYESITKFYLFKWHYMFNETVNPVCFADFKVPQRLQDIYESYFIESRHFSVTTLIWDYQIFQYMVNTLKVFLGIHLLSEEDVQLIKNDLLDLLDYVENMAAEGKFRETGNPVHFYISDLNLDTDYSFVKINENNISLFRAFVLHSGASTDKTSFEKVKKWIDSLKKLSTYITRSSENFRTQYFNRQREIISELLTHK